MLKQSIVDDSKTQSRNLPLVKPKYIDAAIGNVDKICDFKTESNTHKTNEMKNINSLRNIKNSALVYTDLSYKRKVKKPLYIPKHNNLKKLLLCTKQTELDSSLTITTSPTSYRMKNESLLYNTTYANVKHKGVIYGNIRKNSKIPELKFPPLHYKNNSTQTNWKKENIYTLKFEGPHSHRSTYTKSEIDVNNILKKQQSLSKKRDAQANNIYEINFDERKVKEKAIIKNKFDGIKYCEFLMKILDDKFVDKLLDDIKKEKLQQKKKQQYSDNKYLNHIMTNIQRKIQYINYKNEDLFLKDVANLLDNEITTLNNYIDQNIQALTKIKNFSVLVKEKITNGSYAIPYINEIFAVKNFENIENFDKNSSMQTPDKSKKNVEKKSTETKDEASGKSFNNLYKLSKTSIINQLIDFEKDLLDCSDRVFSGQRTKIITSFLEATEKKSRAKNTQTTNRTYFNFLPLRKCFSHYDLESNIILEMAVLKRRSKSFDSANENKNGKFPIVNMKGDISFFNNKVKIVRPKLKSKFANKANSHKNKKDEDSKTKLFSHIYKGKKKEKKKVNFFPIEDEESQKTIEQIVIPEEEEEPKEEVKEAPKNVGIRKIKMGGGRGGFLKDLNNQNIDDEFDILRRESEAKKRREEEELKKNQKENEELYRKYSKALKAKNLKNVINEYDEIDLSSKKKATKKDKHIKLNIKKGKSNELAYKFLEFGDESQKTNKDHPTFSINVADLNSLDKLSNLQSPKSSNINNSITPGTPSEKKPKLMSLEFNRYVNEQKFKENPDFVPGYDAADAILKNLENNMNAAMGDSSKTIKNSNKDLLGIINPKDMNFQRLKEASNKKIEGMPNNKAESNKNIEKNNTSPKKVDKAKNDKPGSINLLKAQEGSSPANVNDPKKEHMETIEEEEVHKNVKKRFEKNTYNKKEIFSHTISKIYPVSNNISPIKSHFFNPKKTLSRSVAKIKLLLPGVKRLKNAFKFNDYNDLKFENEEEYKKFLNKANYFKNVKEEPKEKPKPPTKVMFRVFEEDKEIIIPKEENKEEDKEEQKQQAKDMKYKNILKIFKRMLEKLGNMSSNDYMAYLESRYKDDSQEGDDLLNAQERLNKFVEKLNRDVEVSNNQRNILADECKVFDYKEKMTNTLSDRFYSYSPKRTFRSNKSKLSRLFRDLSLN